MVDAIFEFLSSLMSGNSITTVIASFGWGIASVILSPCHLSSIPLIVGYINSRGEISIKRTFLISLVFGIGVLITIALIGLITVLAGRLMGDIGVIGNYIIALVFFIIGLYLLDIIKLPWESANLKPIKQKGIFSAFILGLLFGIGLGPCTFAYMAPVLGVVFQTARTNILFSIILLFAFAIGHCAVIVSAGTLTKKVQQYLNWTEKSNITLYIKRLCGILVILAGVYMIINSL